MTMPSYRHPVRLRRSVLCVPADNPKALSKVTALDCDAVIYDLEDAVSPEKKTQSRAALVAHLAQGRRPGLGVPNREVPGREVPDREVIVRINSLSSGFGEEDLMALVSADIDALLLPKVESPQDIQAVADMLSESDAPETLRLWAMIETPRGVLNAAAIAETGRTRGGRLDCFVPGVNDLRKDTGVADAPGRAYLVPWLMQILLCARGSGLDIIDGVFNDFRDADGFSGECAQGRAMGFDGKMLIHPAQIGPANAVFGVDAPALAEALSVIDAFALAENTGKAVVNLQGRMVERLHLDQALRLAAKAAAIQRKGTET